MTTTFTKTPKRHGSDSTRWNVDRDGAPFGQIWVFTCDLSKQFHAKALNGAYARVANLAAAKDFMAQV